MKKLFIFVILIFLVNFCFATTVYFRKGGSIEGEVISKDDEKFVLKTASGEEKTIKWRQVKNKTIKEIYPELYEALKAKALARRNKKKAKEAGEKKDKSDINFSKINISVETTERSGSYEKIRTEGPRKFYKRDNHGLIKIKLTGLNHKKKYLIKTVYSHYFKGVNKGDKTESDELNIVNENEVFGKNSCNLEIETGSYSTYKVKLKSGWRFENGRGKKETWGSKAAGWDVSIWINGTLVYEKKKGKDPVYYHNISH